MFKQINDKINVSFETEVAKSAEAIISALKLKAERRQRSTFVLPRQIDYKEFRFTDNEIEIRSVPNIFSAFRAFGKIKLTSREISPARTRVICEVMTGNNSVPFLLAIQTLMLIGWSIFWVIFGWRLDPITRFGVPLLVIVVSNGVSVFKTIRDRRSLIDYSDQIMRQIKT